MMDEKKVLRALNDIATELHQMNEALMQLQKFNKPHKIDTDISEEELKTLNKALDMNE